MKMFVGVTDYEWFRLLQRADYREINFWRPSGQGFRALGVGDLFLFKLHSPNDYIVGGGIFVKASILPSSLAWEAFGRANGVDSLDGLHSRISKYRSINRLADPDPQIGCIILSYPFFFEEADWIPVPANWKSNIVQGKTYTTDEEHGQMLYIQIRDRLSHRNDFEEYAFESHEADRYGRGQIIKPRIGQGAFRIIVTDAYGRKCAVTGEKTLPVLEAAHIKPYSREGPHDIRNGILLRKDFHTLFDRGYITVNKDLRVEVSRRIKEDYGNGRDYYAHHGDKLLILPHRKEHLPDANFLEWHNENVYLG